MPHYKDGTPAEIGDLCKGPSSQAGGEIHGKIVSIQEAATSCNMRVACFTKASHVYRKLEPDGSPDKYFDAKAEPIILTETIGNFEKLL